MSWFFDFTHRLCSVVLTQAAHVVPLRNSAPEGLARSFPDHGQSNLMIRLVAWSAAEKSENVQFYLALKQHDLDKLEARLETSGLYLMMISRCPLNWSWCSFVCCFVIRLLVVCLVFVCLLLLYAVICFFLVVLGLFFRMQARLWRVSDPTSSEYQNYLTNDQILQLIAPSYAISMVCSSHCALVFVCCYSSLLVLPSVLVFFFSSMILSTVYLFVYGSPL